MGHEAAELRGREAVIQVRHVCVPEQQQQQSQMALTVEGEQTLTDSKHGRGKFGQMDKDNFGLALFQTC